MVFPGAYGCYPIASMGLVYLPTFTIKKPTIPVDKYTVRPMDGSPGYCFPSFSRDFGPF